MRQERQRSERVRCAPTPNQVLLPERQDLPPLSETASVEPRTPDPEHRDRLTDPKTDPAVRQDLPPDAKYSFLASKPDPVDRPTLLHGYDKYFLEDAKYFILDIETLNDKYSFPDAMLENPDDKDTDAERQVLHPGRLD